MTRCAEFDDKFKTLPSMPGVYLMKDSSGKIIYVGKSKCLKNRVSSYFNSSHALYSKTQKLVDRIYDFDIIVTSTEAEALILENELIKRHNPKYNIKLKDAKTYPYIKITKELYPSLVLARTRNERKSEYFGPYTSAIAAKDIISTVSKTFRLATCGKKFIHGKRICRPCLNYHIGQCCAPCTGDISPDEYEGLFKEAAYFLGGNYGATKASLEEKMLRASEELRFEDAAKYRDSINNLKRLSEKQSVVSSPKNEEDYFGWYDSDTISCIAVLKVRSGHISDKECIFLSVDEITDSEALGDFILRYYDNYDMIPRRIFISFSLAENGEKELSETLTQLSGHTVDVHHPEKGEKRSLCDIAVSNAKEASVTRNLALQHDEKLLIKITSLLQLECLPERIESYDISNSASSDMYAGMIVINGTKFSKSDYRTFSIKNQAIQDDYAAMRQALDRRTDHIGADDDSSMSNRPDLILLDGGKNHVRVIKELFYSKGIDIPVFGMVKDDYHKTRTLTDGECEISIAKDQSVFSFFYRIQEEVHRYTFSKMDASRRKKVKTSSLADIPGIGEAKAKALLSHFGTLKAVKQASIDELCGVSGISRAIAEKIILHYSDKEKKQ